MGVKLGLLSFAAPPAVGGGSVYVESLAHAVEECDLVDEFHVFCESALDSTRNHLEEFPSTQLHRVFAVRATKKDKSRLDYLRFGVQQFQYLKVVRLLLRLELDTLLVHSDVVRYPSMLPFVLWAARRAGTQTVLDVRDIGLPSNRARVLGDFDRVLACGQGPSAHVARLSGGKVEADVVPVPFQPVAVLAPEALKSALFARLGVPEPANFVLMAGGLTPAKDPVEAALTAMALARLTDSGLPIVSCGPERIKDPQIDRARAEGALIYAGKVDAPSHLALNALADCVASFSIREGVPRAILEGLAHQKVLFAPSCVPEFAGLPQLTGTPEEKALQILEAIENGQVSADYDLSQHAPVRVLERLGRLLGWP